MVYLDNAATTKPFKEVVDAMSICQDTYFGNPSSTHSVGRKSRAAIEQARKSIARIIGASSSEIIFTSGGTEADNIFLKGITESVNHFISTPLEHPAVLNTLDEIENSGLAEVSWLSVDEKGRFTLDDLEELLNTFPGSVVVLMHGNNEIGNLLDLDKTAELCQRHNSPLFTDAVQTMGHYSINVKKHQLTGLAASAHKFHGPKGVGFLYLKKSTPLSSIYHGGEQEKRLRVGTENVAGIVGMAKALELCYSTLVNDQNHVRNLKSALILELKEAIPEIQFIGCSEDEAVSINSVLSVSLPPHPDNEMLLFNLDMAGLAVSAGSACASGAQKESNVLKAIGHHADRAVIRFSMSRMNTADDISFAVDKLKEIYC